MLTLFKDSSLSMCLDCICVLHRPSIGSPCGSIGLDKTVALTRMSLMCLLGLLTWAGQMANHRNWTGPNADPCMAYSDCSAGPIRVWALSQAESTYSNLHKVKKDLPLLWKLWVKLVTKLKAKWVRRATFLVAMYSIVTMPFVLEDFIAAV